MLSVARGEFNVRFDPLPHAVPADFGDIREDAQGIAVWRHPEMILLDEYPSLLPVFDAFRAGQVEISQADWNELTAPEYDAKVILADCRQRNIARGWSRARGDA